MREVSEGKDKEQPVGQVYGEGALEECTRGVGKPVAVSCRQHRVVCALASPAGAVIFLSAVSPSCHYLDHRSRHWLFCCRRRRHNFRLLICSLLRNDQHCTSLMCIKPNCVDSHAPDTGATLSV